jgi:hypothetical protein
MKRCDFEAVVIGRIMNGDVVSLKNVGASVENIFHVFYLFLLFCLLCSM